MTNRPIDLDHNGKTWRMKLADMVKEARGWVGKVKKRDSKPGLNLMTRSVTLPYVGWDLSLADRAGEGWLDQPP